MRIHCIILEIVVDEKVWWMKWQWINKNSLYMYIRMMICACIYVYTYVCTNVRVCCIIRYIS